MTLNHFVQFSDSSYDYHIDLFSKRKISGSAVLSSGRRWILHHAALAHYSSIEGEMRPWWEYIYTNLLRFKFIEVIEYRVLLGFHLTNSHSTVGAGDIGRSWPVTINIRRRGKLIQSKCMACHRAEPHQDQHSKELCLASHIDLHIIFKSKKGAGSRFFPNQKCQGRHLDLATGNLEWCRRDSRRCKYSGSERSAVIFQNLDLEITNTHAGMRSSDSRIRGAFMRQEQNVSRLQQWRLDRDGDSDANEIRKPVSRQLFTTCSRGHIITEYLAVAAVEPYKYTNWVFIIAKSPSSYSYRTTREKEI